MADTLSPSERSKRMSLIRSENTKPELAIRKALHARGLRYRIHRRDLPGRPDMVFSSRRAVIFINGCFWHGHKCTIGHVPKSNSAFWQAKIQTNRARDARNICKLRAMGWKVLVVWECRMQGVKNFAGVVDGIEARLRRLDSIKN